MKKSFLLLILLSACTATKPSPDGPRKTKGGGRNVPVTVSATAKDDHADAKVFLVSKDPEEPWTKAERTCIRQLYNALELAGYKAATNANEADLKVTVDLPPPSQAKGFNFVAMMGGFKHEVTLEAKDKAEKTAWKIDAFANQESDQRAQVFPLLALAMVGKVGTNINGEEIVHADEDDPRLDQINAERAKAPATP